MQISGTYQKTLYKNMTTGRIRFSLRSEDTTLPLSEYGTLLCEGVLSEYPKGTPLTLEGVFLETGLLEVNQCTEGSKNEAEVLAFLSGGLFPGIGPKSAKKIYDLLGGDPFQNIFLPDSEEKLAKAGIKEEIASHLATVIKVFRGMDEVLDLIRSFGGTYLDAYLLHCAYGSKASETLKNHPYCATELGTAYAVSERIAKAEGVSYYDAERIHALLAECFHRAEQNGHTAMTLSGLLETARCVEADADCGYETPEYFLCGHLLGADFCMYHKDGVQYVQTAEKNAQERMVATRIRALEAPENRKETEPDKIRKIEEELSVTYAPEQREAFRLLETPGLKILTGGPGTGKTTVLNGLIRYYRAKYPYPVKLCSPTAAAAERMRETTGYPAETVHRALGLIGRGQKAKTSRNTLEKGFLIVDEASMLDTEIFSLLLEQTLPGSILLLVGDEEQLESVGPGNVLADLLSDETIPAVRLQTVYRQESTSSILRNSQKIRQGDAELEEDPNTEFFPARTDNELAEMAIKLMEHYYDKAHPFQTKLLCPVRNARYTYGTANLNRKLQERLNPDAEESLQYGENRFSIGDPVQMTKNNYAGGYINGDLGIVTELGTGFGGFLAIKLEGKGEEIRVMGRDLADVSLAYAQTVHKSQGGECDNCIILLPERPRSMLYRKILYVAATRAKKKNLFVIQNHADRIAIENTGHVKRITGLNYQLQNL